MWNDLEEREEKNDIISQIKLKNKEVSHCPDLPGPNFDF